MHQPGFFDLSDAYGRLDAAGDPLARLDGLVDWSGLDVLMRSIVFDSNTNGGRGGRKPLCCLMMAKILILRACNNLSDERAEFLINDRLSYCLLYTSPSPRDRTRSRMPSSA